MFKWFNLLLFLCVVIKSTKCLIQVWAYAKLICGDNNRIITANVYSYSQYYDVVIVQELKAFTEIKVKFDSGGSIVLDSKNSEGKNVSKFTREPDLINNIYTFQILEDVSGYKFQVVGKLPPEHPPYLISLKINDEEKCLNPTRTVFHSSTRIEDYWSTAPDKYCGRRRIYKKHTELIVSGSATKSGYWPWHVAIYGQQHSSLRYRCGGTLLSTLIVLTAAHCVTKNGAPMNPESIGVVLGKFSLHGTDITTQDKEVFRIVVHEEFDYRKLNNDIALIKLDSEANFNNYVQPACLWFDDIYDQLDSYQVNGTVVGWGFDQTESQASELHETIIPLVPESICIRYDPVFYSNMLNGKKFCAGHNNGTAACNGDSGGGFVVFVPDARTPSFSYPLERRPGAWYVKGIVSVTLAKEDSSLCDPKAYTVFTDVAKYRNWILKYLK